ncbi:unnamed protein product, partial [Auanema sp. JU1783]
MQDDIADHVKSCLDCQQRNMDPRHMTVEPLGTFIIPTKPFARIHMDIMGPFPISRQDNTHVLSIQDSFTKFAVAIAVPNITAEVVIDRFLRHFVYTFGPPARLITDRGSNFMSTKFQNMCKTVGIKHEPTLPHQKNSNGQVERL